MSTAQPASAPQPRIIMHPVLADATPRMRAEPFWRMQDEGLDKVVFYDREHPAITDWHRVTGPDAAWLVRVHDNSVMVPDGNGMALRPALCAVAWINCFTGRSGMVHFAVFRPWRDEAVHLGRCFMHWAFGTGKFDSLAGITPAAYHHALGFIRRVGFIPSARLPGACHLLRHGRHVDGVISVATLATLEAACHE